MNKRITLGSCLVILLVLLFAQGHGTQAAPQAQLTVFPTPTPGPDGKIIYIVQPNDTLWRISAITGVKIEVIRDLNKMGVNDNIRPGDKLLIGFAGPASGSPTEGPAPTQAFLTPSPTPLPGWGKLCVLLYNDANGDSMRQETEPSILDGEISVSNRLGSVSLTAQTPSGGTDSAAKTPEEKGYTCFDQLAQGTYLVSVAAPEGYNRTTSLNQTLNLDAGQTTLLAFGAQPNSELAAETTLVPEPPRTSNLLGIIGGLLLFAGVSLGVYAVLLRRGGAVRKIDQ